MSLARQLADLIATLSIVDSEQEIISTQVFS
jgi:hypothetical protein